jgi:nitrite reductase (NADH) small subunit
MSNFIKIGSESELPARNEAKEFACEGKTFCVSNVDGHFHAMDNECLHRGGPLGQGTVEDGKVVCPWHGWQWDPNTGQAVHNAGARLNVYELKVENGEVMLKL